MLTDTHCHLYLPEFEDDLEKVMQKARDAGLKKILVPGIDLLTSRKAVALAEKYPGFIFAAVGIHPNYSSKKDLELIGALHDLLYHPGVVAVGEIGLDYYRRFSEKDIQIKTFEAMLTLAKEFNKPVCLHQRESTKDMLGLLDNWFYELTKTSSPLIDKPGVFHSFGGDKELLNWAENHQFYFGISGYVTYKKATELVNCLPNLNRNKLLIETDAPYLTPIPHRGTRNDPSLTKIISAKIAESINVDKTSLLKTTFDNSVRLFGW